MIKSISIWSIPKGTRFEDAMQQAKRARYAAIELGFALEGELTPSSSREDCEKIRATAASVGVALETLASGMSWGVSPTHPDAEVRKRSIQIHRDALQRVAWLGAQAMLFVPGAVRVPWNPEYQPVRYDQAVKWAREAVLSLAETAEQVNVDLCVENVWNGMFYSPLEFAQFIDDIGSPRVGIYFDVGNVLGYHQHPPHWIEILGKRIRRVHIKDFRNSVGNITGFCDLLQGDVPWKETMNALRAIGYDKTLVAEMMPPDPTLLERTSRAMDEILSM